MYLLGHKRLGGVPRVSPGVPLGVCALLAMAHVGGFGHCVAHDVDCIREVAVHLGHAVAVALVLLVPASFFQNWAPGASENMQTGGHKWHMM